MFILKIVLGIALVLLILLFIFICLLLFCKIGIHIQKNKYFQIDIKIWFIKIKVYPIKKSEQTGNYEYKYEHNPVNDKNFSKLSDLDWYFDFILSIITDLKDKIYIDRLYLNVTFASDDAAKTGIMLGSAFSLSGMIIPILNKSFYIKEQHVVFNADFNSKQTLFFIDFILHTRLIKILLIAFKYRNQLFKIYKDIK